MKYVMFVCGEPDVPAEDEAAAPDLDAWFDYVDAKGAHLHSVRLQAPADAVTVRVRGGKPLVTDGPFAETREWIAGFAILECASQEDAVDIALRNPMAYAGRLEVRPVHSSTLDD